MTPTPREPAPTLTVPLLGGGTYVLADETPETFSIVVFYRGKHCPLCRKYLLEIQSAMDDIHALGARVIAVSMDSAERATASAEEWGIDRLPLGYAMDEATARAWGLFISSARPGSQEPDRFSEPGLMVVRPDGTLFFVAVQSAPFTRPPIMDLIGGLKFVLENDYPARGDLTRQAA